MLSSIKTLKKGSKVHLMGICGTAMASLAGLLQEKGFKVTGSDSHPYPPMSDQIRGLGIEIMTPYAAKNLQLAQPDFVIVGNVISASNEEAQELNRMKTPYSSLPQAMGDLIIDGRDSYVIAGTHGKTTTTSMLSWIMDQQGLNPGFLIGGIPKNFSKSFRTPTANSFVIEGDEYDTAYFDKVPKFIHYHPKNVIFTSAEFDHADIYKDFAAVESAFTRLMQLIPNDGLLVHWGDDPVVEKIAGKTKARKVSYGFKSADYIAKVLLVDEKGTRFQLTHQKTGKVFEDFQFQLSGNYNVMNAAAVCVMALELNWDIKKLKSALQSFTGVKRRQEILGEPGGVLVVEDFAHHPTAVKETLKGLKDKYPQKKIFAVFEPRSATSRRRVFQNDYVTAFKSADVALIAKAFDQSKIDPNDRFSSEELVETLKSKGQKAQVFESTDEIVNSLREQTHRGDLVLIMSNGGFDGIYTKLLAALK